MKMNLLLINFCIRVSLSVKSGDEEEIRLGRYYDKKFRKDYRKYIWKIKKPKRKFRLWMYYHFKICV